MKNGIKKIYDDSYQYSQYHKKGWHCSIGDNDVPLTFVLEITDMYEATGDESYKDYNYVATLGLVNLNIHESVQSKVSDGETYDLSALLGYYGMNCYLDGKIMQIDEDNQRLFEKLPISKACLSTYVCRFSGKNKQYLKFKTFEDAKAFNESLIEAYSQVIMGLVGFYLDNPINLVGTTAWDQTRLFEVGVVDA